MDAASRQMRLGLQGALAFADAEGGTERRRARLRRQVETTHELMSQLPEFNDLAFLHSGLCQTHLPHSKPPEDHAVWRRDSGRFSLIVSPGVLAMPGGGTRYVGVPYGSRARLILIYLQTEGLKGRTVSLGKSLSAFMRSLNLAVTGGKNGTINAVREQSMRIARCSFSLQWTTSDARGDRTIITDSRLVEGLDLWRSSDDAYDWSAEVQLSEKFYEHLREHAVPLDKRALALLSDKSLGLDLYAFLAYRLPRLSKPFVLRWGALQEQIGSSYQEPRHLKRKIEDIAGDVRAAYPHANFELLDGGLLLSPSQPAVPKTLVNGCRLISSAD
jgi:hypothetical protein